MIWVLGLSAPHFLSVWRRVVCAKLLNILPHVPRVSRQMHLSLSSGHRGALLLQILAPGMGCAARHSIRADTRKFFAQTCLV